jgi:mono/diheme cytochrome c family protein
MALAAVGLGVTNAVASGPLADGVGLFSAGQAKAGQVAYQRYCASCHGRDLAGRGEATALAGLDFIAHWRRRTTADLFQYIQITMPPGSPGDAGFQVDLSIVAFILEANGSIAGGQSLAPTTVVAIGSVANGRMPPAVRAALSSRP